MFGERSNSVTGTSKQSVGGVNVTRLREKQMGPEAVRELDLIVEKFARLCQVKPEDFEHRPEFNDRPNLEIYTELRKFQSKLKRIALNKLFDKVQFIKNQEELKQEEKKINS